MGRFFSIFLLHSQLSAVSAYVCQALASPLEVHSCVLLTAKLTEGTGCFLILLDQPQLYIYPVHLGLRNRTFSVLLPLSTPQLSSFLYLSRLLDKK